MKGFTLVELVTVALIFALILIATFAVLDMGRRSWQTGTTQAEVQQQARQAMNRMIKELRGAGSITEIGDNSIEFESLGGQTIKFAIGVEGYNEDQLIRTLDAGTPAIVANDIEDIQFYLFGADAVYITLTTQKSSIFGPLAEAVLNSQVVLRN